MSIMDRLNWLSKLCKPIIRDGSFEEQRQTFGEMVKCDGDYELRDILSQTSNIKWPVWYLNLETSDKALEIAKGFHKKFEKLKFSSSIAVYLFPVKEAFSALLGPSKELDQVEALLEEACKKNDPKLIIKTYTLQQKFSHHLHKHSAANTFHSLKLYCTLLNCPILAYTQQYTEAFTSILFHPKLDEFLVRNKTVYRGLTIKNDASISKYEQNDIIITTTLLSTSKNREVAECFASTSRENEISVFHTYNIHGTTRRTALDIETISKHPHEEEVLILRFIPFLVKSIIYKKDGRRIEIVCDEYTEPIIQK